MSKSVIAILFLAAAVTATAQAPSIVSSIAAKGNITLCQPEALARLVETPAVAPTETEGDDTPAATTHAAVTRSGYRVQIFDDNNPRTARSQAEARHSQVQALFPHMRAYVTFNSPYWRVKVGDFRTRAEAEAAMAELRHAFPSMAAYMRIVREKINTFD